MPSKYSKDYYEKHKEERLRKEREKRASRTPEQIETDRAKSRAYYFAHRERILEMRRERESLPEQKELRKQRYEAVKDERNKKIREKRANYSPEQKAKIKAQVHEYYLTHKEGLAQRQREKNAALSEEEREEKRKRQREYAQKRAALPKKEKTPEQLESAKRSRHKYYLAHKEELIRKQREKRAKARAEENPSEPMERRVLKSDEAKQANDKAYREKHKEEIRAYQKAYRKKNKEKAKEYQQKYRNDPENQEKAKQYQEEYRKRKKRTMR